MSLGIYMPPVGQPPLPGRVLRVRRMPGHYVQQFEPVIDVQMGTVIVTVCAPEAGKVMRCSGVGELVQPYEMISQVTAVGTPTRELFFGYRRRDASGHAGRLGDHLIAMFGAGQVFKDIETLRPGVDFPTEVRSALKRMVAIVVIIGPHWLTAVDKQGKRRLDKDDDLHREEIRTALLRGIAIFPVLVDGATMPSPDELPDDIRGFADRQALEISDTRWGYDVDQLATAVGRVLWDSPRRKAFVDQVPLDKNETKHWVMDDPLGDG